MDCGVGKKLELLNREIAYARAHSPFYSYLPRKPIRSMDELKKIRRITADDLINNGEQMICCSLTELRRIVSLNTSGTTGKKKRVFFTDSDLGKTIDFFRNGMNCLMKGGEKCAIFMPGAQPDGLCDLLSTGIREFGGISSVYGAVKDYEAAETFLSREKPDVIVGIPTEMRRLSLIMKNRIDIWHPRRVLLSADYCSESLKETIERCWNTEVYEHYGLTESGLGCAVERPRERGMMVRGDMFLFTDENGEIILTTLDREALPLICYRTGDLGEMESPNILKVVYGRKDELEKPVSSEKMDDLLFAEDTLLEYQAVITENGVLQVDVLPDYRKITDFGLFQNKILLKIKNRFPGQPVRIVENRSGDFWDSDKRSVRCLCAEPDHEKGKIQMKEREGVV